MGPTWTTAAPLARESVLESLSVEKVTKYVPIVRINIIPAGEQREGRSARFQKRRKEVEERKMEVKRREMSSRGKEREELTGGGGSLENHLRVKVPVCANLYALRDRWQRREEEEEGRGTEGARDLGT